MTIVSIATDQLLTRIYDHDISAIKLSQWIQADKRVRKVFHQVLKEKTEWCQSHQPYISNVISKICNKREQDSIGLEVGKRISSIAKNKGVETPSLLIKENRTVELHALLKGATTKEIKEVIKVALSQDSELEEEALVLLLRFLPCENREHLFRSANPNLLKRAAERLNFQRVNFLLDMCPKFLHWKLFETNPLIDLYKRSDVESKKMCKLLLERSPSGFLKECCSAEQYEDFAFFTYVLQNLPKRKSFESHYIETSEVFGNFPFHISAESYFKFIELFMENCPQKTLEKCFFSGDRPPSFIHIAINLERIDFIKNVINKCPEVLKSHILKNSLGKYTFLNNAVDKKLWELVLFFLEKCPNQCRKELLYQHLHNGVLLAEIFAESDYHFVPLVQAVYPLVSVNHVNNELTFILEEDQGFLNRFSAVELPEKESIKKEVSIAYAHITTTGNRDLGLSKIRNFANNPTIYMPYLVQVPQLLKALLEDDPQVIERYIIGQSLEQQVKEAYLPLLPPKDVYDTICSIPANEVEERLSAVHVTPEKVGTVGEILQDIYDQFKESERISLVLNNYLPMLPPATISLFAKEHPDLIEPFLPFLPDSYLAITIPVLETKIIQKKVDYIRFANLKQKRELLNKLPFTPPIVSEFREKKDTLDLPLYKSRIIPLLPHLRWSLRLAASFVPIEVNSILASKLQIEPQTVNYSKYPETTPFRRQVSLKLKKAFEEIYEMEASFKKLEKKIEAEEQKHPVEFLDPCDWELMEEPWCIPGKNSNYILDKRSLIQMDGYNDGMIRHPITREHVSIEKCYKDETLLKKLTAYL